MDPRRLLIFRAVARAGSISAAARELGWTQPAVSQHLRALERSAGCALLLRGAGGVDLTEPGRVLLARADALAVQLHMAEEELADLTELRRGRVRLAAYPSAAATLVPRAVAGLRARHPDVDVELTEAEPPEALDLLSAGDVDLALVFSYDGARPERGLVWRSLADEPVALVVGADHPAATRRRLTLSDLAEEPWIVGCERCRAHAMLVCAEAGFEPAVRHVSDDYVVVQNLVAVGLGVTLAAPVGTRRLPAPRRTRPRAPVVRHPDVRDRPPGGRRAGPGNGRAGARAGRLTGSGRVSYRAASVRGVGARNTTHSQK